MFSDLSGVKIDAKKGDIFCKLNVSALYDIWVSVLALKIDLY